jgi:hypothetical protein
MVIAECALSNPILPYSPGETQQVPSAAARIANVTCVRTGEGYLFTFDVEVFPSCWKPVYSIRVVDVPEDASLRPAACPSGWDAGQTQTLIPVAGGFAFRTESNPISPGIRLSGFAVSAGLSPIVVRWYPTDQNGMLIGKASRLDLACPTGTEPGTWGSIKAIFR